MPKRRDISGQVFGQLTAISHVVGRKWLCRCQCGVEVAVAVDKLRAGHTRSCGHLRVESIHARNHKHGHAPRGGGTKAYFAWRNMVARCTNPRIASYKNYGGRGVTICKRWGAFTNFLSDMGEPGAGYTLERKDNNEGYTPSNCVWATRSEQMRNTRRSRVLTYDGRSMCVLDWAAWIGMPHSSLYYWLGRYGEEGLERAIKKYKGGVIYVE